ncbi:TetR/AcrR family transcriptional regulator [Mariprofundus erugo]|uniref:TetR/AcrR family transcriptional regulator n=1 Tax=Mariprofundus erugo TaxID=2528639 RepID=A0A5R9GS20_9PROT|nr:TetR/AcrR family transcriptional regulator [Mariprofundus erugo]TLS67885.1 TetR/AcrR family transcriptional regulator [Mariprofundus erugo]
MSGETKILDAAASLFSARGVDAVSIREIAEAAGISKATVFHYFDSKDTLYQAVVRRSCEGIGAYVEQLVAREDSHSLAALADYHRRDFEEMQAHADVVRLVLRELTLGHDRQARALAEDVFGGQFIHLRRLLEKSQQAGTLRSDIDTGVAAVSMVSINLFLLLVWPVLRHLPDTPFVRMDTAAESMFSLLIHGLRESNHPKEQGK